MTTITEIEEHYEPISFNSAYERFMEHYKEKINRFSVSNFLNISQSSLFDQRNIIRANMRHIFLGENKNNDI